MAALSVLAPVAGTVVALADVDDPVFSGEIVGPGLAIEPDPVAGGRVVAPVAGTVVKMHPHAFVLATDDGKGVLVHLGINTVQMGGEGFTLHATEQDRVEPGQVLVEWDPAAVTASGRPAVCPVIALDADPSAVERLAAPGTAIAPGDPLLAIG
ncbi:PTS sugar transporter subunit IIA [Cellulomonas denverensis]|uniref:PTS glucose transporter subunit IIA n=1 Tax=Cellulomonas denverensis TaxID=264297 RepID=A0A7X6KXW4_9CELL|nr:PTS glucose transporter subunit IIA [Cellulomonas denverensis]NKY24148.1 PTS glucose transporter subunit IIA [Cellulomonas denverensis]GIG25326.1 PTS glucose transporter subunit IIA [Cellulomonas denverensis]